MVQQRNDYSQGSSNGQPVKRHAYGILQLKNFSLKTGLIVSGITALVGGSAAALSSRQTSDVAANHNIDNPTHITQSLDDTGPVERNPVSPNPPSQSAHVSNTSSGETVVTTDGQTVTVPANGTYNKTTSSNGNTTTVKISNQSRQNGSTSTTNNSFSSTTTYSSNNVAGGSSAH